METPLFEHVAVFERGIGEVTDVVEKELFRLAPRSDDGDVFALRPEATAGIVRAYLQHGLQTLPQPVKVSLVGPMFRYDRPQAGRYRQFWQWDVEAIGDPGPAVDAELIELGLRFYRDAGLDDVEILLNSIGDGDLPTGLRRGAPGPFPAPCGSRSRRLERARLETNPLRLLDSKDPRDGGAQRGGAEHPRPPVRRVRGALRRGPRPSRRARGRVPARPAARPRPRLLHADHRSSTTDTGA